MIVKLNSYKVKKLKSGYSLGGTRLRRSLASSQRGYSLVEIMVVLALFAILVLVATQTLLLSLRSANKSEALGRVKENLEYSVSIMERYLRGAKSITTTCPNTDTNTLSFIDKDDVARTFSCVNPGVDGYINLNTNRLTDQKISVLSCTIACSTVIGSPPSVEITIVAQDKSSVPGADQAQATSKTTVVLRQF